jgi:hypothetical protein
MPTGTDGVVLQSLAGREPPTIRSATRLLAPPLEAVLAVQAVGVPPTTEEVTVLVPSAAAVGGSSALPRQTGAHGGLPLHHDALAVGPADIAGTRRRRHGRVAVHVRVRAEPVVRRGTLAPDRVVPEAANGVSAAELRGTFVVFLLSLSGTVGTVGAIGAIRAIHVSDRL